MVERAIETYLDTVNNHIFNFFESDYVDSDFSVEGYSRIFNFDFRSNLDLSCSSSLSNLLGISSLTGENIGWGKFFLDEKMGFASFYTTFENEIVFNNLLQLGKGCFVFKKEFTGIRMN